MQVLSAMDMVSPDTAMVGRGASEFHACAEVVLACGAVVAFVARDAGLDGDAVARLEVCYVGADAEDLAGAFVTENVVVFNNAGADCAGFPEVQV